MTMDQAPSLLQFGYSMAAAVFGLGGVAMLGAWMLTRGDPPCNPYGHDACACGCGTNCEEGVGG